MNNVEKDIPEGSSTRELDERRDTCSGGSCWHVLLIFHRRHTLYVTHTRVSRVVCFWTSARV